MSHMKGFEDSLFLPEIEGTFWFDTLEGLAFPKTAGMVPADNVGQLPRGAPLGTDNSEPASEMEPSKRKSRGRGRGLDKADTETEEKRQKNREIQARYRARQKAIKEELEVAYGQLSDEIEREKSDYVISSEKNGLMEKILVFREKAVAVLEGSNSSQRLTESSSGDSMLSEGSLPRRLVQSVYQRMSSDLGSPIQSISEAYAVASHLDSEHTDQVYNDPHLSALASTVKELTGEQLVRGWHAFALALRDILDKAGMDITLHGAQLPPGQDFDYANPPGALAEALPLFQEQVVVLGSALRHNLPAVQTLFATAADVVDLGGDAPSRWREIVQAMQLTDSQRSKVLAHYTAYQAKMRRLEEHRRNVAQSLAATVKEGSSITSLQRMMEEYLSLFDSSGKIAAEPNGELLAMLDLMRNMGRVFTMPQKVKMVAMAYPAFPDIVHVMRAVAPVQDIDLKSSTAAEEHRGNCGRS